MRQAYHVTGRGELLFKNAGACVDQRLSTLLPQLADVEVEHIDQAADLVQILARTRANQATCPTCGVP
jgi:hypothetical protein